MNFRFKVRPKVHYPKNPNVPSESKSLGQILKIYKETGSLIAPMVEGDFQVEYDENNNIHFPKESEEIPSVISKIDFASKARSEMFPIPQAPSTEPIE